VCNLQIKMASYFCSHICLEAQLDGMVSSTSLVSTSSHWAEPQHFSVTGHAHAHSWIFAFQLTRTQTTSYLANSYLSQLVPNANPYPSQPVPNTNSYPNQLVPKVNSYPKNQGTYITHFGSYRHHCHYVASLKRAVLRSDCIGAAVHAVDFAGVEGVPNVEWTCSVVA